MDTKENQQIELDLDFSDATSTIDSILMDADGLNDPGFSIYTTNMGTGPVWQDTISVSDIMTIQPNNTIQVNGEGADIVVNGESLMDTLRGIQDRLNILRPNTELEAEWDELRELGDQYRKLEAQFAEKTKMWSALKKMPPPEIE
jgi:hypothetical protein